MEIVEYTTPAGLLSVEEDVAELTDSEFWKVNYRPEEAGYWGPIPEWLEEYTPSHLPGSVLDVGMGWGVLSWFCARLGWEVSGIDVVPFRGGEELLEAMGCPFEICNTEKPEPLPLPGPHDLVILADTLEHFQYNPLSPLTVIFNAMHDFGKLVISTPCLGLGWADEGWVRNFEDIPYWKQGDRFDDYDKRYKTYSPPELQRLLLAADFVTERMSIHISKATLRGHITAIASKADQINTSPRC